MDTLKRALKKSEGEETASCALQTFLEVYRSTPNPNSPNGQTPAESFLGRKMRTVFDLIPKPPVISQAKDSHMENQYNRKHGTRNRSFNHGDLVYAKNFKGNKSYWVPGEIIERVGNVIYNTLIEVDDRHILVRAHTDQLRSRDFDDQHSTEQPAKLPLDILLEEFQIDLTSNEDFATPPTSPRVTPKQITSRRQPVDPISRSPHAT